MQQDHAVKDRANKKVGRNCLAALSVASIYLCSATTSSAAPVRFNCHSAPRNFSEIELFQAGPEYAVRGSITARQFRYDSRYLAAGTVGVHSKDKKNRVAVQVAQDVGKNLNSKIIADIGGKRKILLMTHVGIGESVPFSIEASASGPTVVIVAGHRTELPVNLGTGARISVTCSTGDFEFLDLVWAVTPVSD